MMPTDPEPRKATHAEARAMAHPIRWRLIELLREGPSTASRLGRELGESSGATSYHLRMLARAGLIEDDPAHEGGRERWWRRKDDFLTISFPDAEDREGLAIEAELRAGVAEIDEEALRRFVVGAPEVGPEWRSASFVAGWSLYLTAEEVEELTAGIRNVIRATIRSHPERSAGAKRVLITYRALPWLE
jgi:DNA-binding transcriptional ArsR family regulator